MSTVNSKIQYQYKFNMTKYMKTIYENFQSQPSLKIEVKNYLDDFFNNNNYDSHIKKPIKKIKESKLYQLVNFTAYVEKLYGTD
ncbi:unnamed protein product [Paramecium octaurelia]|uniref:Uncharacterized protein n=1 Tax=Paramecium octaurelia TaxID=43137 RepID=A0A8S1VXY0_PAROT|nr:unnamed protein product [Paramecium octaurelia]